MRAGAASRRYVKFLTVGSLNAAVDLLVLNGLALWFQPRSAAAWTVCNSVAVICAIANSYFWNRRWTFADTADGSLRERLGFLAQAVVNLLVNDGILYWSSGIMARMQVWPAVIENNVAKGLAMLAASTVSYACLRGWVFHRHRMSAVWHGLMGEPRKTE